MEVEFEKLGCIPATVVSVPMKMEINSLQEKSIIAYIH